jgi:hypothetical protein
MGSAPRSTQSPLSPRAPTQPRSLTERSAYRGPERAQSDTSLPAISARRSTGHVGSDAKGKGRHLPVWLLRQRRRMQGVPMSDRHPVKKRKRSLSIKSLVRPAKKPATAAEINSRRRTSNRAGKRLSSSPRGALDSAVLSHAKYIAIRRAISVNPFRFTALSRSRSAQSPSMLFNIRSNNASADAVGMPALWSCLISPRWRYT